MPPPRHIAIETVGPRSLHGANAEQHGGRYEAVFLTYDPLPVLSVSSNNLGVNQLVSRLFYQSMHSVMLKIRSATAFVLSLSAVSERALVSFR